MRTAIWDDQTGTIVMLGTPEADALMADMGMAPTRSTLTLVLYYFYDSEGVAAVRDDDGNEPTATARAVLDQF